MGYKIQYSTKKKPQIVNIRLPLLILVFFFLFCLFIENIWPDGAYYLEKIGIFSDRAEAVAALNDLVDEMRYEDDLGSFLKTMVRKIIP